VITGRSAVRVFWTGMVTCAVIGTGMGPSHAIRPEVIAWAAPISAELVVPARTQSATDAASPTRAGPPTLPPHVAEVRTRQALGWAASQIGTAYRLGAEGPDAWDCSSLTQAALARVGILVPRTAESQRSWLRAGHGSLVPAGEERPGDLVFFESYLGPGIAGHVAFVADPVRGTTLEAHSPARGVGIFAGLSDRPGRLEVWRVRALAGRT
jgi:cell wall-associated NlpC family hydrolase